MAVLITGLRRECVAQRYQSFQWAKACSRVGFFQNSRRLSLIAQARPVLRFIARSAANHKIVESPFNALAPASRCLAPLQETRACRGDATRPNEAKTGVLTLDGSSNANGIWIFKIVPVPQTPTPTGALTGTNFSVVMAGGGDASNVTWWSQAATTITRGSFKGSVLSGAGFTATGTATTGSTFDGQALAKAGVTATDMTITGCEGGSSGGKSKSKCNQGVGNGPENCDPGNSNQDGHNSNPFIDAGNTNDELGGTPRPLLRVPAHRVGLGQVNYSGCSATHSADRAKGRRSSCD